MLHRLNFNYYSVSLSSLDSEEHDDHLRINSSSNPAGISTYSLNDAEFIVCYEYIYKLLPTLSKFLKLHSVILNEQV